MADRILGMGDIVSLVEKAQEHFDEGQAAALQKKIAKDQFTFSDFLDQLRQVKKMGNIKDLMSMIPGAGKALKDVDIDNESFQSIEAIILSMTKTERENPALMNGSRRKRIADGSGTSVQEVNRLMKQFDDMRRMMKMMSNKGNAQRMMRNMPGMK
jgi:signal recognition particle subunit SRP54